MQHAIEIEGRHMKTVKLFPLILQYFAGNNVKLMAKMDFCGVQWKKRQRRRRRRKRSKNIVNTHEFLITF